MELPSGPSVQSRQPASPLHTWSCQACTTALLTAGAIFAIGWFTSLRGAFYAALIASASIALLPMAIAFALLVLTLAAFGVPVLAAAALSTVFGAELWGGAAEGLPAYYRWLVQHRHPAFWGVLFGVVSGGTAVWLFLAICIWPGEAETVETLVAVKQQIETAYARSHRYPQPTARGQITWESIGVAHRHGIILDGFGRPLRYSKKGAWRLASFRLASCGYDGKPGRDDFCISGETRLAWIAGSVSIFAGHDRWSISARLRAIHDLRCNEGETDAEEH